MKYVFSIFIVVALFGLQIAPTYAGCISGSGSGACTEYLDPNNCTNAGCTWEAASGSPPAGSGSPPASSGNPTQAGFVKEVKLKNPITGAPATDGDGLALVELVVSNVIKTLLGLTGVFALLGFIWGGVTWMTSYGDTAKVERGRKMMTWSVVGLIVIFASYAIANYIFEAIGVTGAATTAVDPENDPARLLGQFK